MDCPPVDAHAVAAWSASALAELDLDDRAAAVRVRLTPSPLPRGQVVRVAVDGVGTADALRDALLDQLAGLDLADPLGLRLEVLDGAGAPIAGQTARGRLRSPPSPQPQDPTMAATGSRSQTQTAQAGQVIDLPDPDIAADIMTLRELAGGAPADDSARGWAQLAQGALSMALLTQHRVIQDQRVAHGRLLATIEQQAETVRRGGAARDELLEEVLPALISAIGQSSSAAAEAAITRVEADAEQKIMRARHGDSRVDDVARVLGELRSTAVEVRRTAAARALAGAPPASSAGASQERTETPPPVTPPPDPSAPPAEEPGLLHRILSGQVPATVAADGLIGLVDDAQRPHLLALARAILATAGEEVSQ